MKSVYKYTGKLKDIIIYSIPKNSKILHVDMQDDDSEDVCIWALCDVDETEFESVWIRIAGTGHHIIDESAEFRYINTFTVFEKKLWFHAFEIIERP